MPQGKGTYIKRGRPSKASKARGLAAAKSERVRSSAIGRKAAAQNRRRMLGKVNKKK